MKRRFSKILGIGLTLALLVSLLMTAAPVSADVSEPRVTVDPSTISAVDAEYAIRFELDEQLTGGSTVGLNGGNYNLAEIGDSFVITSPTIGTATITVAANTAVTVALSGGATSTYTAGANQDIAFAAVNQTATVTATTAAPTTGLCTGSWAVGSATGATAVVTVGDELADTITIVFPSGTTIIDSPTVTMVAGPGWINGVWESADTTGTIGVVGTVDTRTVVITLDTPNRIGEGAEVRLAFTAGITNPDDAGDYNLTVATSKETTAVPSADYAIEVPDITVLPGIVEQYNAADPMVLMARATGDTAINTMVDSAGVDYTIVVGAGEYTIAATIDLDQAGLTFKSSDGAGDTIIDASALTSAHHTDGSGILVDAADVTVDGFTVVDASACNIYLLNADDAIIQNNVVTFEDSGNGIDISSSATGVTVSGNEFSELAQMFVHGTDATLSGNTFGECVNISGTVVGLTITGNIMIGSAAEAIDFISGTFTDVLIEDNTISEAALNAIVIRGTITNLQILDNDITDNEGVGILIVDGVSITAPGGAIAIKFNTITGNDADNDGYGIQNDDDDPANVVDATFNWWGTAVADDVAAMVNDTATSGSVTAYDPFLADTYDAVFSASDVAVGVISIAKDTADVAVSVTLGDVVATQRMVNVISVAKYISNPEEALAGAIAFYDVYVAGTYDKPDDDSATIKFYAGDAQTEVYIWSADTLTWGEVTPVSHSAYGGYVYVTIEDPAMLAGTPFALVAGAVTEPGIPEILVPVIGDDTVSLTPIFAWEAVTGADGYYFEMADNANFVLAKPSLTGDLGRLIVTAYAHVEELPYSTPYYWRVKAVSGTVEAGNLAESAWASGVFITMDEPVEEAPPIVVEEAPPVVIETIQPPDIIVEIPAETAITPGWIYVIIAVGAVLVIAMVVLIVRTRRVA